MKAGKLVDPEPFRINSTDSSHPSARIARPPRVTRTPYSEEDDRELVAWVAQAESKGISTKGNDIYQQLEKRNPRHTYQSWRDRWIKHLSLQHRPNVAVDNSPGPVRTIYRKPKSEASAHPTPPRRSSAMSSAVPRSRASPAQRSTPARQPPTPRHSSPVPPSSPPSGTPIFTAEDDEILETEYPDLLKLNPGKLIAAWTEFARAVSIYSRLLLLETNHFTVWPS